MGTVAIATAITTFPSEAEGAADQTWPPFILIAGLLLIGYVANHEGLFEWLGHRIAVLVDGSLAFFFASMAMAALVTAILNLDTSVVFVTPVLIHAARAKGIGEAPFLYGSVFMANSASLLLPGSNLTNLLVVHEGSAGGSAFLASYWPTWIAAILICSLVVAAFHIGEFKTSGPERVSTQETMPKGPGSIGVLVAAVAVIALPHPAIPVFILGAIIVVLGRALGNATFSGAIEAADPPMLFGLFGIAVALGTVARTWAFPAEYLSSAGSIATATTGAFGSIGLNNLPAAMLFSSEPVAHPQALLIGLNLGPNLAISGSLAAVLWLRSAHRVGATPSILRYSMIGAVLAPLTIAGALLALYITS